MKKIIIVLFAFSLLFIFSSKENDIIIPNNSIIDRVVANSDSLEDQNEKLIIKQKIEKEVYNLIGNANSSLEEIGRDSCRERV